ncbi:MAG: hypothetical protein HFH48_06895, partial [Lachnospiraceae bacterium]|nr:hypothetical protein [Lachnospiraceae bacterium]
MERKNAWKKYPEGKREAVFEFGEKYRKFISDCKTERECVTELTAQAKEAGFEDLKDVLASGRTIKTGDKIYAENMGKMLALFVIGRQPLEQGMNILGAHIDSPRLDLKQVPLYEDTEMALLDTHYYGPKGALGATRRVRVADVRGSSVAPNSSPWSIRPG